jgi:hypothetical protein
LTRAKEAGAVRDDIGAMDVLMMLKGVFEAASAFASSEPGMVTRQLDLVRAAISAHSADRPLRGRTPTLADIERAFPQDQGRRQSRLTRDVGRRDGTRRPANAS